MSQKDIAASIRERLLNLAKERHEDFNFVLTRYAIQRLLYRLSISEYRDRFILKGAWLFSIWSEGLYRPTRDADFLGYGVSDAQQLLDTVQRICSLHADDGLVFDPDSFRAVEIKEDAIYQGVRITGFAELARARIAIQLDIAFGDVLTPAVETAMIPVDLGLPAPELKVYPVYSVIAEKFQAMVALGMVNTRMKDFYDIWRIAQMMTLDGVLLSQAIRATFSHRQTGLVEALPFVFSAEFRQDAPKQAQWKAFLRRIGDESTIDFSELMGQLSAFLVPVYRAATNDAQWDNRWLPEKWQWLEA